MSEKYWRSDVLIEHIRDQVFFVRIIRKNAKVAKIIEDLKIETLSNYNYNDFVCFIVDLTSLQDYQRLSDLGFCYTIIHKGITNYDNSPQIFDFSEATYIASIKEDTRHTLLTLLELAEQSPELNSKRKHRSVPDERYNHLNFVLS